MTTEFIHISLGCLGRSPTNPRKSFPQDSLNSLADSIRQIGIIEPLVVRPWPEEQAVPAGDFLPSYEIVAGERRYRAADIAGLEEVPCIVRQLTDHEVAAIQMIENLQREDIHPLEEAEGYRHMLDNLGYTVDGLAEALGKGKSRGYIYGRLKLLTLSPEVRDEFRNGTLDASTALLIARIPGTKLQQQAMEEILGKSPRWPYNQRQMSVREAQKHCRERYTLRLDTAPFALWKDSLIPTAGSCNDCPNRSGNALDLFPDIDNVDVCTDPDCFEAKKAAHLEILKRKHEEAGRKVIEAEEAAQLRNSHGNYKGLVLLDETNYSAGINPETDTYYTNREILAKANPEAQATAVVETDGKGIKEAVDTTTMAEAFKAVGLKPTGRPEFDRSKEEEKKARQETAFRQHLHERLRSRLASTQPDDDCGEYAFFKDELVAIAQTMWDRTGHDDLIPIAKLWLPEDPTGPKIEIHERVRQVESTIHRLNVPDLGKMILDLAVAGQLKCHTYSIKSTPARLNTLATLHGIDVEAERETFFAAEKPDKPSKKAKATHPATPAGSTPTPTEAAPAAEVSRALVGERVRVVADVERDGRDLMGDTGEVTEIQKHGLMVRMDWNEGIVYLDHGDVELVAAEAPEPTLAAGDWVKVKDDAKGPNGILRKCCGHAGQVESVNGDQATIKTTQPYVATYNLPAADLEKLPSPPKSCAGAVMYTHPEEPTLTWNGRGRKPKWVESWLRTEGNTLDQLLAAPADDETPESRGQANLANEKSDIETNEKPKGKQRAAACEDHQRCTKTVDMFEVTK